MSKSESDIEELKAKLDEVGITVQIQNVVASVDLHVKIKLEMAASLLATRAEVSYIPEQFPGLVVKLTEPSTSALIFSSGKMVITGAKSAESIKETVDILARELEDAITRRKANKEPEITIQNIVASGNLGSKINLEIAALLLDNSMYEPEQFPGLIYRLDNPKTVLLLFQSGNTVCTGAKKEEYVYQAVMTVKEQLEEIDALVEDQPGEERVMEFYLEG